MLENMKMELEKENFDINPYHDADFVWCHFKEGEESYSYRLDVEYEEEKKKFTIHILQVDKHKKMKNEINRTIEWVKNKVLEKYGTDITIILRRSTPVKEAWNYPTYRFYERESPLLQALG